MNLTERERLTVANVTGKLGGVKYTLWVLNEPPDNVIGDKFGGGILLGFCEASPEDAERWPRRNTYNAIHT